MRAIYERGIGSHERKDLFDNCQNTDGLIRVYRRQNVQDINSIIVTRVRDLIYETENSNDQTLVILVLKTSFKLHAVISQKLIENMNRPKMT
ncbi:hypothetical protein M9Y10_022165 [Tritrichomonas musculus]|uniref:Uncharacterized protein n=1 Tax=Tritrichomonas musculus TaxID=1915356 RepID=A0ABR2KSI6_9EUKA